MVNTAVLPNQVLCQQRDPFIVYEGVSKEPIDANKLETAVVSGELFNKNVITKTIVEKNKFYQFSTHTLVKGLLIKWPHLINASPDQLIMEVALQRVGEARIKEHFESIKAAKSCFDDVVSCMSARQVVIAKRNLTRYSKDMADMQQDAIWQYNETYPMPSKTSKKLDLPESNDWQTNVDFAQEAVERCNIIADNSKGAIPTLEVSYYDERKRLKRLDNDVIEDVANSIAVSKQRSKARKN